MNLLGGFLGLGSSLLGAFGGAQGASSQNIAAANQSEAQRQEMLAARRRQGMLLLGPEDYRDFDLATSPETTTYVSKKSGLGGLFGGTTTTTIDNTDKVRAAQNRFFGKYGNAQDQLAQLSQQYLGNMRADQGAMIRDNEALDRGAAEMEGAARDNQAAMTARARYNTDRARMGADQRATAALGGLGTSSLLGSQLAGNARSFNNDFLDRLTSINQAGLNNWNAARNTRLGIQARNAGMMNQSRGALSAAQYQFGREPIDQRQSLVNGSAFQPYTPLATSAGMSASGSALGSLGLSLGGLAGRIGEM